MAIKSSSPGHDYMVFLSVEPNKYQRDDAPLRFPELKFQCNVIIKYVPDRTDASIPTNFKDHDSWRIFQLPTDLLTCGDNFSSIQPRGYMYQMLKLMKIPFELDRLFWKKSRRDKESVPLGSHHKIVTLILDAACAMADGIGVSKGKGLFLLVTVEKVVTVPHREYVGMLKAKQEDLFRKVQDKVVRMLRLEEQGHEFPKPEWKNMVDLVAESGLSQAEQNYLTSLMKQSSKECTQY